MLYKEEKKYFLGKIEDILTLSMIIACLFLFYIFPSSNVAQGVTLSFGFLFVLPALYIKLVLKSTLVEFGFSLSDWKNGLFWGSAMLLVSLLLAFLISYFFPLAENYKLPTYIKESFWLFLAYELIFVNLFFITQEFFFKGFVLFSISKRIGQWSILSIPIIYLLFMFSTKSLDWQIVPMLILSLTGAVVSYKSRSFVYAYAMGMIFLIFFDTYIIHILNK